MSSQRTGFALVLAFSCSAGGGAVAAQQGSDRSTVTQNSEPAAPVNVPALVRVTGIARDQNQQPMRGAHLLTFSIYSIQDGGQPLWAQHETLELDEQGRYSVLLGSQAAQGLPLTLFVSGEARWLGVQTEGIEQPRVLLISVPYALKAADAETLGGRPASDYALAKPTVDSTESSSGKDKVTAAAAPAGGGTEKAARWEATAPIGPGFIADATSGPPLQVFSAELVANLNADFLDGLHAAAFPKLAASNTFVAPQLVTGSATAPIFRVSQSGTGQALSAISASGEALHAESATGTGVVGIGSGTNGFGIWGISTSTNSGNTTGVVGQAASPLSGMGVFGEASATSGNTTGVRGRVFSANGVAGVFDNNGGGDILLGRSSFTPVFRVDNTGAVRASSFRNLDGTPIPSGDITGVSAGGGLSGGGATGDVSLALDTTFTNGLYAAKLHQHSVADVSNAATLGANTFNGSQSITGSLAVSVDASFEGGIAAFGGPTKANATGVRGQTTSDIAEGVLGVSISSTGRGVRGITSGNAGTGVTAQADSTSGTTTGLLATVASPDGTAGIFSTAGGGTILRGTAQGAEKFRVDGNGAVYAGSYRDLAGNPIPVGTGDITAVAAGSGLTGGGTSGDVSLGLNTAFTDGRYAALVHGHDVSQVTNAATLGANTFTGGQTISGSLTVNGTATAPWGNFLGTTGSDGGGVPIPLVRVVQGGAGNALFLENTQDGFGHALWARGVNFPILATATSGSGVAIRADATSPIGQTNGVLGVASSTGGFGIRGDAVASTGNNKGVLGQSFSTAGVGVEGVATASSGTTAGVRGTANSPGGTAGLFDNVAGGNLVVGQVNNVTKFRVDGTGAVYASSYRDAAGNPIPSGTGDITGVSAGEGLSGGGAAGDVALTLNTAFTDGRYASAIHGHSVSDVTDAARLTGGNSFGGNQSIAGSVSATGNIGALTGVFDGGLTGFGGTGKPNATGVRGETTSAAAEGVLGANIAPSGRGVRGYAAGASGIGVQGFAESTGDTRGVQGVVSSPNGMGVQGLANAGSGPAFGVYGASTSPDGTGVRGHAGTSIGAALGVHGTANGETGTGVKGEAGHGSGSTVGVLGLAASPAGVAGLFDAQGGGNILVGRAMSAEKFRVDGTGAVYASSYRDLTGNPIPVGTGDITGVSAGFGLTGGGVSGDVGVALDTSFTDARYAALNHGHNVSQISGAATLSSNTFAGTQTIHGAIDLFTVATSAFASSHRNQSTAPGSGGVYGEGTKWGITGIGTGTTNTSIGVWGSVVSDPAGLGVFGWHNVGSGTGSGVRGTTTSPSGVGVSGDALATTGTPTGVQGVVLSANGVAGRFDNDGGGTILLGRVGGVAKFRVDGAGNVFANTFNLGGADFAESVAVTGSKETYEPGDTLIIDSAARRTVTRSQTAYSTMVAGIYSTKPGVIASPYGLDDARLAAEIPLAMIGIVPCKVTAENGAIAAGDLLVTSSIAGHAMKGTDRARMLGAVIGKALEPLRQGTGVILVLVTLQ